MSASYAYVNHDKDQWFGCGILGGASKFSAIGRGAAARGLAILLSDRGTWRGDRVSVIDDYSKQYEMLYVSAVNIEVEVELMLIEVDGLEWIERELDENSRMFRQMCAFALLLRRQDITNMLNAKYGVGKWQRLYEKSLHGNTDTWSQQIVEAANRGLKLLSQI